VEKVGIIPPNLYKCITVFIFEGGNKFENNNEEIEGEIW